MLIHSRKYDGSRRGGITVWLLLGLSILIGLLALGLDGGRMQQERRRAQAAADAAALAAAADLYQNWWVYKGKDVPKTARAAALAAATDNGYANDDKTSIVTVNIPPTSGAFVGKAEYVEVIAEYRVGATFGKVFTKTDLPVRARSVAHGGPMRIGLHMLHPSAANAFRNQAVALAVLGSPIIVNSKDSQAFHHASIGPLIATRYDVSGDYVNSGGGLMLGKMRTKVRPTADPLRKLPTPPLAGVPLRSANPLVINNILPLPVVLQPGLYQGGIEIKGLSIVVMNPGLYILDGGGFQVQGLASVVGLGTTLYNTEGAFPAGPISVTSAGKVIMTAPTGGTYQGVSIFQDRTLTQPITVTGLATVALTGTVYAVGADVTLASLLNLGLDTLGGAYIVSTLQVGGIGSVNIDLGNNYPRVPDVTLVE